MSLPSNSRDLIKVDEKKSNLPIKFNPNEINQALQLVDKDLFLKNREDVKKYLNNVEIYAQQPVDLVVFCIQDLDDESINQIKNINLLKDAIFYDINYKNDTIDMLKGLGLVQHMNFYDGLGMLVEQAAESYNFWFNFYPTTEPVKKILYERL